MTLWQIKKVTEGFNSIVRVEFFGRENENPIDINKFNKAELENLKVIKVVGTAYPMFENAIVITVDWI